jgi:hypothetical protein
VMDLGMGRAGGPRCHLGVERILINGSINCFLIVVFGVVAVFSSRSIIVFIVANIQIQIITPHTST